MDKNEILKQHNIINHMIDIITKSFSPEKILLFGSRARGEEIIDSDVDLLVIMNIDKKDKRKIKQQMYCKLSGIGLSKDIVVVTPVEVEKYKNIIGTVIYPAIQEGKVLYEKAS